MTTVTKIHNSTLWNTLGRQVARVIYARAALVQRRWRVQGLDNPFVRRLAEDGFLAITNFLTEQELNAVQEEFEKAIVNPRFITKQVLDSANILRTAVSISLREERYFPYTVAKFLKNPWLLSIIKGYDGRRVLDSRPYILEVAFWRLEVSTTLRRRVLQSDHTNCELHSDSFQSLVKAFFYLHNTRRESGAHRVVPGSHRLGINRLLFEYWNSITEKAESPRPPQSLIRRLGGERALEYAANTLIIEDTFAFHGACLLEPGRHRDIIYLQYRSLPFDLVP